MTNQIPQNSNGFNFEVQSNDSVKIKAVEKQILSILNSNYITYNEFNRIISDLNELKESSILLFK